MIRQETAKAWVGIVSNAANADAVSFKQSA
jgi:hypothetical protein